MNTADVDRENFVVHMEIPRRRAPRMPISRSTPGSNPSQSKTTTGARQTESTVRPAAAGSVNASRIGRISTRHGTFDVDEESVDPASLTTAAKPAPALSPGTASTGDRGALLFGLNSASCRR